MTTNSIALPGAASPNGTQQPVAEYRAHAVPIWFSIGFGMVFILMPIVFAVMSSIQQGEADAGSLISGVVFFPVGLFFVWIGQRQKKMKLTLWEDRFEFVDNREICHRAHYADVESLDMRTSQGNANCLIVYPRGKPSLRIKGLSPNDTEAAYDEIQRRRKQLDAGSPACSDSTVANVV